MKGLRRSLTQAGRMELAEYRFTYGDSVGMWFMLLIWAAHKKGVK